MKNFFQAYGKGWDINLTFAQDLGFRCLDIMGKDKMLSPNFCYILAANFLLYFAF